MADRALFKRGLVSAEDRATELELELAEEAARLLGYSKLKQTVAGVKEIRELSQVLQDLDVQPFPTNSVRRYKAEAPDAAELTDVPEFFKRHRKLACLLLWLIALWAILSAIGIAVGWFLSWKLGVASVLSILVIFTKGCKFDDRLAALFQKWERLPLAEYQEEVPLYVLQKAVEIKKQLPAAEFYVEQRAEDPFLIVTCGEREEYIEAWREPRFEASVANPMLRERA